MALVQHCRHFKKEGQAGWLRAGLGRPHELGRWLRFSEFFVANFGAGLTQQRTLNALTASDMCASVRACMCVSVWNFTLITSTLCLRATFGACRLLFSRFLTAATPASLSVCPSACLPLGSPACLLLCSFAGHQLCPAHPKLTQLFAASFTPSLLDNSCQRRQAKQ